MLWCVGISSYIENIGKARDYDGYKERVSVPPAYKADVSIPQTRVVHIDRLD